MYCSFFGLREKPFAITPNPRFVFFSKNHKEAFAHLLYGIENHAGFIALTGEVGTGKTTVLRTILEQLDDDRHRLALVFNPAISALDLLGFINREFGIPCNDNCNSRLLENLNQFLLQENSAGRTVVLVIDEAQNLTSQVLEQIRLISNLETSNDKLIQIVLAGQPELADMLAQTELRQLNQRITVRYHLRAMDFNDMKSYIEHRLEIAGGGWVVAFKHRAMSMLFKETGGIPRLINVICDRALLIAYGEEKREITPTVMTQAINEVRGELHRRPATMHWRRIVLSLLGILIMGLAIFHMNSRKSRSASVNAAVQMPPTPTVAQVVQELPDSGYLEPSLNRIIRFWNVPPLDEGNQTGQTLAEIDQQLSSRKIRLYRFNGSLGLLLRINAPSVLELVVPSGNGRCFLVLVGVSGDRLEFQPYLRNRNYLTRNELEKVWTGRAYIPWNNELDIRVPIGIGKTGAGVKALQGLLLKSGALQGNPSGRYDSSTQAAIRKLQASWGLEADGRVGEQTLFLLYRSALQDAMPRLRGSRDEGKP
jgi:general secretion pathway protein A